MPDPACSETGLEEQARVVAGIQGQTGVGFPCDLWGRVCSRRDNVLERRRMLAKGSLQFQGQHEDALVKDGFHVGFFGAVVDQQPRQVAKASNAGGQAGQVQAQNRCEGCQGGSVGRDRAIGVRVQAACVQPDGSASLLDQ